MPILLLAAGNAWAHSGHEAEAGHIHGELWLIGLAAVAIAAWFALRNRP
ncbi:MAG: hypothetical protein AB7O31_04275 [Burkholderiales bacterium]